MTIRIHLSRLMGERKVRISDVHRGTGISRNTLSTLYHETSGGITWDTLARLCTFLDCQPGDLLELVPDEPAGGESSSKP